MQPVRIHRWPSDRRPIISISSIGRVEGPFDSISGRAGLNGSRRLMAGRRRFVSISIDHSFSCCVYIRRRGRRMFTCASRSRPAYCQNSGGIYFQDRGPVWVRRSRTATQPKVSRDVHTTSTFPTASGSSTALDGLDRSRHRSIINCCSQRASNRDPSEQHPGHVLLKKPHYRNADTRLEVGDTAAHHE